MPQEAPPASFKVREKVDVCGLPVIRRAENVRRIHGDRNHTACVRHAYGIYTRQGRVENIQSHGDIIGCLDDEVTVVPDKGGEAVAGQCRKYMRLAAVNIERNALNGSVGRRIHRNQIVADFE